MGAEVCQCVGWPEMRRGTVCEHVHNFFTLKWLERSRVAVLCDPILVTQSLFTPSSVLQPTRMSLGNTRKLGFKPLASAVSGASKYTALIPVRSVYTLA